MGGFQSSPQLQSVSRSPSREIGSATRRAMNEDAQLRAQQHMTENVVNVEFEKGEDRNFVILLYN